MDDAYLYFTAETGDPITTGAGHTFSKTICLHQINELGKGHQKFIEIWSDGGFTTGATTTDIRLLTGTTTPGNTVLMHLMNAVSCATLSVAGLKAKIPLPSVGLLSYITLDSTDDAIEDGGKIMARIVLNP